MDENDAILVLDKVLIPRENVFISGSLKGIAAQFFERFICLAEYDSSPSAAGIRRPPRVIPEKEREP